MSVARAGAALALVLALAAAAAAVGPASGHATGGPSQAATGLQETPTPTPDGDRPAVDRTVTRIRLYPNGSATWTVGFRTALADDEDAAAYRAFQETFRNDTERYLGPFRERMRGVVADAGAVTGREMNATSFTAETTIQQAPRRAGVVAYSFRWTNFARVTDGRLVVGDAFEGGLALARNDSLIVVVPDGYAVASADPADRVGERRATWVGPAEFPDRRPRVIAAPVDAAATPTPTPDGGGGLPLALVGLVALVAAAVGGVALYARREGEGGGADDPPPEVLTDAERVERMLAEQGGRAKQADVAEAMDWSPSKTSRVLSRMADEGTVEKLQIGRENVIDLVDGEDD
jgi:uncharacterized membrane protein